MQIIRLENMLVCSDGWCRAWSKTLSSPEATPWPQREGGGRERVANAPKKMFFYPGNVLLRKKTNLSLAEMYSTKNIQNFRWANENVHL